MTDEEWNKFVDWWKSQWSDAPSRTTVELYLKWKQDTKEKKHGKS